MGNQVYTSIHLKQRQADYYRHLESVRTEGNWQVWFDFFLSGIEKVAIDAAERARQLHRRVSEDRRKLLTTETATVSAVQLFEQLPDHPVISMPLVTRLLETTKPTAGKAIELLRCAGIVSEVGERKRDRLYSYAPYIELLS